MRKLFIIGNGFDLAHGLKTTYKDFHIYLRQTYFDYENVCDEDFESDDFYYNADLPEFSIANHGEDVCDEIILLSFIGKVISTAERGNKWSDLEETLAHLDFSEFLDEWGFDDEEDDDNHDRDKMYRVEDRANNIRLAMSQLSNYFTEWINSIILKDIIQKSDFNNLIDTKKDLFLTFNYTSTLESIYNCYNVLHIHGRIGEKLLFGHGDDNFDWEYYEANYFGAQDEIADLYTSLRKNTSEAIKKNLSFFRNLAQVDSIYTFGFSFSDVDKVYIEEICKNLSNKVVWYLNDFDDETDRACYSKMIKKCGFKGVFDTYHVS